MRVIVWGIVLLVVVFIAYLFILGVRSKSGAAAGLVDDELAQCGPKPNCVCSEQREQDDFYIEPLRLNEGAAGSMTTLRTVVQEMGGELVSETDTYLAATFTSGLFGFVDDLEVRLDQEEGVLHVRSASRVGHSDLGVNRKRVEQLRTLLQEREK
ncbi:MAG: DUF1499 domain-containing protein [Thiolinea sp.]